MAMNQEKVIFKTSGYAGPSPVVASVQDYVACRDIMLAASMNYSFASKVLPAGKLHHVEALYALLRIGDDRVDVSHNGFRSPLAAIDDWENTYWKAFEAGDSPHPVMRAYIDTAFRFSIPAEMMEPYFRAMREDLSITRFPTFSDLLHYMDGSAIPVGRGMTYILGVRKPYSLRTAMAHADCLSIAMQLSNFWRDIGEDWRRGRIYIPQEDMAAFDINESDIAAGKVTPQIIGLLEHEIQRAESYYQHALEGVQMLGTGRWAVMSGLEIYRAILRGIRKNNYDVFTRKASTSRMEKLGLLARAKWNTFS